MAPLLARYPTKENVTSLIPGEGMHPDGGSVQSQDAYERQPINVSPHIHVSLPHLLPPFGFFNT